MPETVLADLPFEPGHEVAVLDLGARRDADQELYILYDTVDERSCARGLKIAALQLRRQLLHLAGDGRRDADHHDARRRAQRLLAVAVPLARPDRREGAVKPWPSATPRPSGDIDLASRRSIENRAYLSEIDGAIGDGDHGVNMGKGFPPPAERLALAAPRRSALAGDAGRGPGDGDRRVDGAALRRLVPGMADALGDREVIDAAAFSAMLDAGLAAIQAIGSAKVGDKTLLDALVPAREAFAAAWKAGKPLATALDAMAVAAEKGRDSTKRPGRQGRPGQPAGRALARRARCRRDVLRPHPDHHGEVPAGARGGVTPPPDRPRMCAGPAHRRGRGTALERAGRRQGGYVDERERSTQ